MKTTIYQRLKILPVLLFGFTTIFGSSFSTHFRVSPKYPSKDKDACKNKPNNVLTAWLPRSQSWICIRQSVLASPALKVMAVFLATNVQIVKYPEITLVMDTHPLQLRTDFYFWMEKIGKPFEKWSVYAKN